jgi:hypothetical protein
MSGFAGQVRCQRYRRQNFLYWLRRRLLRERSASTRVRHYVLARPHGWTARCMRGIGDGELITGLTFITFNANAFEPFGSFARDDLVGVITSSQSLHSCH